MSIVSSTAHGTYVLILRLEQATAITVGRLGTFTFRAGWYAYVGSAFGGGGLSGRLKHHLDPAKTLHWHIDYLTQAARVREIWTCASETGYEHTWAAVLGAMPEGITPIPRFGSSDCRCAAHLFYFRKKPVLRIFRERAHEDCKQAIKRWSV